jgi:hypothetical protein
VTIEREYGQEWRDEVKTTKYPFTDTSSLITLDNLLFDKEAVYDASFYVINWNSRLYMTKIEIITDPNKIARIHIGDVSTISAAYADIDPFNVPSIITFTDALGRQAGMMVVDPVALSFLQSWTLGTHLFRTEAEFVPSVVTPMPTGYVTSIKDSTNDVLKGDIWLIGESGVVIRTEGANVRVDIVGDPLYKRLAYSDPTQFPTPRFVKTINGYSPDENGEFKIVVGDYLANDTILRIYPDPSLPGLRVELVGQTLQAIV